MTSLILAMAAVAIAPPAEPMVPIDRNLPLMRLGIDRAPGLLVNFTTGATPTTPPDPGRDTLVIVHGINVLHPVFHLELAQRYAEALAPRWGSSISVLGWDWNGHSRDGLRPSRNSDLAVRQGEDLAHALTHAGLDPARIHLIGQSSGAVVVVSAARALLNQTGRAVARLTLLDPARAQHPLLFQHLQAHTAAHRVEHFWVTGPSGFGKPAPYPGVIDRALEGPAKWGGFVRPSHLDHMHVVRWHIGQMATNPWNSPLTGP